MMDGDEGKKGNVQIRNRRRGDPLESEAHKHRRGTDGDSVLYLHTRITDCEGNIQLLFELEQKHIEEMGKLNSNMSRIAELLEVWANIKGFQSVVKYTWPILLIIGAVVILFKTGKWILPGD